MTLSLVKRLPDVPPHDLAAEAAVLSAVLLDPAALGRLGGMLKPEHFFSEAHRRIFEAASDLGSRGEPIDPVQVGSWLRSRNRLEQVGGMIYLTEVLVAAPHVRNVAAYGLTVFDKWRVRETIGAAHRIAAEGYHEAGDVQTYADRAARSLASIARQQVGTTIENTQDAIRRIVAALVKAGASPGRRVGGVPTGINALDALTLGLHPGQKTTIAALPGRGKTSLALQIATHVARQGIGVVFFSQEQTRDELFTKIIARECRVDGHKLRSACLDQDAWTRVLTGTPKLETLPILIDDTPDLHIGQIQQRTRAEAERMPMIEKVPLGLVVLDYVQRLRGSPETVTRERHHQIADATKGFKLLCQELKIAGIELAQQKPADADKRTGVRPRPSTGCVADSSQIEKEADVVIFLHREPALSAAGKPLGEDSRDISLIVDKQRGGESGEVKVKFEKEFSNFASVAAEYEHSGRDRSWSPEDDGR